MEGLQHCFFPPPLLSDCTAGIWFDGMRVDGEHQPSETMNDEIHMKSDESYSTHIRRQSDSSFICEVMIVEVCFSAVCVHTVCSIVVVAGKYQAS